MEFESLKLSIDETVATIAFSRPEVMNAFNTQQIIDLNEATEIVTVSYTHLTLPTMCVV